MNLYSDGEVCRTCTNGVMHSCGSCLRDCRLNLHPNLEEGICWQYVGKDEKVLARIARQKERADLLDQSVGHCPSCGERTWWWTGTPLEGLCWGDEKQKHPEVRAVPPPKLQPHWNTMVPKEKEEYARRYQEQEKLRHGVQTDKA